MGRLCLGTDTSHMRGLRDEEIKRTQALLFYPDGSLVFTTIQHGRFGDGLRSQGPIPIDEWVHVAVSVQTTGNVTMARMFLDGEEATYIDDQLKQIAPRPVDELPPFNRTRCMLGKSLLRENDWRPTFEGKIAGALC
eukprot:3937985-Rhodomonas_salina.2